MAERIGLDKVLARYGATLEDVEAACVLDSWEMRAIELGLYGNLRLSSAAKIAQAICGAEDDLDEASKAIIISLVGEDARRSRSSE